MVFMIRFQSKQRHISRHNISLLTELNIYVDGFL